MVGARAKALASGGGATWPRGGLARRALVGCVACLATSACDTETTIDKIGLSSSEVMQISSEIFDEFCLAQLPQMEGMQERFVTVVTEKFGKPASLNREVYGVASYGDPKITISRGTPAWRDYGGEYRCEVAADGIKTEEAAIRVQELFETRAGATMSLTEAQPDGPGERQTWTISGTKPGMRLEITSGAALTATGQKQTGMRLAWK
ncbi:MAG: hypothetical protein AAGD47_02690 [Pseudomonadota bacterium]